MSGISSFQLARRFLESSRRLGRSSHLRDRALCGAQDLSPTQWHALGELWESGPMSMNELAERLHITRSTLTRIVDLLEKKNLAKRKSDRDDRRRIVVSLSPRGEEVHQLLEAEIQQSCLEILHGIPPLERGIVVENLEKLARATSRWADRHSVGLTDSTEL